VSNIEPHEFDSLRKEVIELRKDVRDLVDAWKTAQGIVRFVRILGNFAKWVSGVVAAVVALWVLIKMGFRS